MTGLTRHVPMESQSKVTNVSLQGVLQSLPETLSHLIRYAHASGIIRVSERVQPRLRFRTPLSAHRVAPLEDVKVLTIEYRCKYQTKFGPDVIADMTKHVISVSLLYPHRGTMHHYQMCYFVWYELAQHSPHHAYTTSINNPK